MRCHQFFSWINCKIYIKEKMRPARVHCLLFFREKWWKRKFNAFPKGDKSIISTQTPWIIPSIFFLVKLETMSIQKIYVSILLNFCRLKCTISPTWSLTINERLFSSTRGGPTMIFYNVSVQWLCVIAIFFV